MNQRLYSQKTLHTLISRASYGVDFVKIWVEIDRVVRALHCIGVNRPQCDNENKSPQYLDLSF